MALTKAAGSASLKRDGGDRREAVKTPTLDRLKLEASQVRPDRPQSRKDSQRANLWALRERLDEAGPSLQVEERRQLLEETLKDWSTIVPEPMSALDSNEIAQLAHLLNWPDTGSANISVPRVRPGQPGAQ